MGYHSELHVVINFYQDVSLFTEKFISYSSVCIRTTRNMVSSVTNSNCLAQLLIINRSVVSPTLNVNPTLFVIPCKFLGVL